MATRHKILGGKVHVYLRPGSSHWQCASYLAGRNHRVSTKEDGLAAAKEFAEDWYLGLRGKLRRGENLKTERTFRQAAERFELEYEVITQGQRSPVYVDLAKKRLKLHVTPFFGDMGLSEITAGVVQTYRIHRNQLAIEKWKRPPARSTMHQEIVLIRQVLKTALRHGWLQHLPDLSEPYRSAPKLTHRAWFSKEEYKRLYEATRERSQRPKKARYAWEANQLHDFVLFMANTGLRPDEAWRLQFRDVMVVDDDESGERILEITVRGKRGQGYCKSTSGAVNPFERLRKRLRPAHAYGNGRKGVVPGGKTDIVPWIIPKPEDLIFPKRHRQMFQQILKELDLKKDREGRPRTAYSLRHTYISLRLMEGADIYAISKNCRTSVDMIERHYAAHIKSSLNAAMINVRRPKPKKAGVKRRQAQVADGAA